MRTSATGDLFSVKEPETAIGYEATGYFRQKGVICSGESTRVHPAVRAYSFFWRRLYFGAECAYVTIWLA